MRKIAYFISFDWGWIKQRPHFIAEMLSNDYQVDVFYRKANRVQKKDLPNEKPHGMSNLDIKGFRYIPFSAIPVFKNFNLEYINRLNIRRQLPSLKNYDYVWITEPTQIDYVKPLIGDKTKIIYDCMDDVAEFPHIKSNTLLKERVLNDEKYILQKAFLVVCSADYLKNKVLNRAQVKRDDVIIVNNAIELPKKEDSGNIPSSIKELKDTILSMSKPLLYTGTIDAWFDFDTIKVALNEIPDLNIVLLGPMRTTLPKHDRIHHLGTIDRKFLFQIMPCSYGLIMPFKLNELIKSVNPVKLYEYIYTGKPIIATRYGETEKFSQFVNLYSTPQEFVEYVFGIEKVKNDNEYMQMCRDYVSQNTWNSRYKTIKLKMAEE